MMLEPFEDQPVSVLTVGSRAIDRYSVEFMRIIRAPDFPCILTSVPFKAGCVYRALVPADEPEPAHRAVSALRELCRIVADEPEAVAVLFIEQPGTPSLEDDLAMSRAIVAAVGEVARQDDPSRCPMRSDDPAWQLWLDDVALFVNISSPRHVARRSRNLGPCLTLVAQARASFDREGRASEPIRRAIRRRLAAYDAVGPHPALGRYGDPDNRESHQFFLGDGMESFDVTREEGP